MTGEPVRADMTVIVSGNKITAVGRNIDGPAGAKVVDGRGRWLMPGLVDAHAHITNIRSIDEPLLEVALANGVTSELEMGGKNLTNPPPIERVRMRDEIAAGKLVGPTLYVGAPKVRDDKLTNAAGVALVDQFRAEGYDFIKVYNEVPKDGYRGILLRAHQIGMPVYGHVVRAMGLEASLGSGQRGIVHMEEFLYEYFDFRLSEIESDPTKRLDPDAIPYFAEQAKRSEVWVTPTLVFFERMTEQAEDLDAVLAHPRSKYIPGPYYRGNWVRAKNTRALSFDKPQHWRNLRAALAYQVRMTKAFADLGVPLLVGTDSVGTGTTPGFDVHEELVNLVEAGLSPQQVLVAATCSAAQYLGREDFGTIAPGQRADILLLKGDPLQDINNTKKIEGVMANGRWFDRAALDALLEKNRRKDS
jgi:hypothetical protein